MTADRLLPPRAVAGMHVLRAAPALTMVIHGTFRIADGGVTGFGDFLATQHVPAAHAVAWLLTIVEVFGGLTLAAGFAVVPLCLWFIAEHAVGMLTVHLPSGWFVVGGGRNGMEYSALLVVCFVVTAMLAPVVRANRLVPPPAG